MNDLPTSGTPEPSSSSDAQTITELRASIESLRGVFQVLALSGIVISATLLAFLYKEVSMVRRQGNELMAYINEYQTNLAPKIELVRTNLQTFAKSNASIEPLVKKYFSTNTPAATTAPAKP
jgi:hypothetical protein